MLAGEVTAILGAKVNPAGFAAYDAAMGRATASAARAEAAQGKMTASMVAGAGASSKFATAAKGAAAGGALVLAAALTKSISAAASFDKQMDRIGAVTQASSKDLKAMADIAKDLGAKMGVGATQAAGAMEALAKGGLTTKQIIGGGLAGALQLAQAGSMDLAAAAEATANALNLFGMNGGEATHVADALAVAANATTADVSDFAMALSQGGSAAKLAGLSFDETVVALESLAKIGVKGSDAGTSLKAALLQVIDPSKEAAAEMKKLGIDFTDSQGKMKPLGDVADMLRQKIGNLSKEEQVAALKRIAGTDGFRTLASLMEQGGAGVDVLSAGLKRQGDAARVAKDNTDNLSGAWDRFKSSIQNIAIDIGGPFLEPLQNGLDSLGKSLEDLRAGKGDLAAVVRDIKTIGSAIGDVGGAVFDGLNVGDGIKSMFSGVGQAISGVFHTIKSVVTGDIGGVFSGLADIVVGSLKAITAPLRALGPALVGPFKTAGSAILGIFSSLIGGIAKVAETMAGIPGIGRVWKKAAEGARDAQHAIDGLRDSINGVKPPKPIKIDTSDLKAALRDIAGTKIESKVMKILGNDKDAKSKTKALIALGIPPKTARLLANAANLLAGAATAKEAIGKVPASKTVTIAVNPVGLGVIAGVQRQIDALHGKTVKVGTRARGRGPGGSELALVGEGRHAREAVVDPATGFAAMVDRPTLMGLSSSAYVIPEDPLQRGRANSLLGMLAQDLGLNGFEQGKDPDKRKGPKASRTQSRWADRPLPKTVDPTTLPVDELNARVSNAETDAGRWHDQVVSRKEQLTNARKKKKGVSAAEKNLAQARKSAREADAWLRLQKKLAAQAQRYQDQITVATNLANAAGTDMKNANDRHDGPAYETAKATRITRLTKLQALVQAAFSALKVKGGVTGSGLTEQLASLAGDLQDANSAAFDTASDGTFSAAEQARLDELDRDVGLAALTAPTGDDISAATARESFLSGLLGAAQGSGRSASVVGELASMVKQARDDVSSLTTADKSPDLQAQLDQQRQIADLAIGNAQANSRALAVFTGSGDIGSGGGTAWRAAQPQIVVNTLHPGTPDTLAAIAAAANAGNSLQNGIASSRLRVG